MTKSFEYFKEDIEPEELDHIMYRQQVEEEEQYKERNKKGKILLGKAMNRSKNRKFKLYGYSKRIEVLPF